MAGHLKRQKSLRLPGFAHIMSLKTVFLTCCVLCAIGMLMLYDVNINTTASKAVAFMYSRLEHFKLILPSTKDNHTNNESSFSQFNRESAFHFVQNNFTLPSPSKSNKTFKNETAEVFSLTTKMTFNTSLAVQCKESAFIQCIPLKKRSLSKKVFNIVYLRRPVWVPAKDYNLASCQINQCVMSDGPVTHETDIILVNGAGLPDNFKPPKRWPNQTYILANWEPPMHIYADFLNNKNSPWNARIDLIMTYRLDADVFVPYSRLMFRPKPLEHRPDYYKIAQSKTKTAVWMVSQCSTPNRRMEYVKEMRKYIDVDIFGACAHPCPRSNTNCNNWTTTYKFYLSFENSHCKDYVTEKFFKLFEQNVHVIPVVRGGVDYQKHFPNFTFINTADFKTAKDLALHLKKIASDLQTYSKYLEYKDLYVSTPTIDHLCQLCSFVHIHSLPASKSYNLKRWVDDNHCYIPEDI